MVCMVRSWWWLVPLGNRFDRSRARLRSFCHHRRVRWLITVVTLTTLAVQPACGPKGGRSGSDWTAEIRVTDPAALAAAVSMAPAIASKLKTSA